MLGLFNLGPYLGQVFWLQVTLYHKILNLDYNFLPLLQHLWRLFP